MSHKSRMRKAKAETIHREKLFGGRETADDVHRALVFCRACDWCKGTPHERIIVMATLVDVLAKMPHYVAIRRQMNGGVLMSTPSKYGRLVQLTNLVVCKTCAPSAERAAAHPPAGWRDNVIVEIDRGPGADKVMVQVKAKPSDLEAATEDLGVKLLS